MIAKVRTSDSKVVARFPSMADADAEAGHTLIDEAALSGSFTPGCKVQGGAFVPDLAVLQSDLLGVLDGQREVAAMKVMTRGTGKTFEYLHKKLERLDYRSLGTTLFNALALIDKQARFPFLMAEIDLTGDSAAVVMTRWETGMSGSIPDLARVAALAQKGKRAVRAAGTASAKQSAAQITWPT